MNTQQWICDYCDTVANIYPKAYTGYSCKSCEAKLSSYPYRLKSILYQMRERVKTHKDYLGRGITICNLWEKNTTAFCEWALANGYEANLTIDREDNNGNYEPSNCKWVTMKVQADNRRQRRVKGHILKNPSYEWYSVYIASNYIGSYRTYEEAEVVRAEEAHTENTKRNR